MIQTFVEQCVFIRGKGQAHMKQCLSCGVQVEDLRHTCPDCGESDFMQSLSPDQAQSALNAMRRQAEAARHVDRGAELIRQGRYAEAEAALKRAIEINPLNATAHANMGGVFLRQGNAKEAIPWLEKALELNPNLEGVHKALGQARKRKADPILQFHCPICKMALRTAGTSAGKPRYCLKCRTLIYVPFSSGIAATLQPPGRPPRRPIPALAKTLGYAGLAVGGLVGIALNLVSARNVSGLDSAAIVAAGLVGAGMAVTGGLLGALIGWGLSRR